MYKRQSLHKKGEGIKLEPLPSISVKSVSYTHLDVYKRQEYEEISCGIVKAKALDDRVGCAILLEVLKEPWEDIQLNAVFAVQEEVGLRGARAVSYTQDVYKRQALGNVIGVRYGEGSEPRPKIMLAGHMDEIGLIITKIEEGGFLKFSQVGGVDPRILPGHRCV